MKHGPPGRAGRRDPASSVAPIALLWTLPASLSRTRPSRPISAWSFRNELLETEEPLNGVPQHDHQRDRERRENHGRDEEAKPRAGPLAPPLDARTPLRAVVAIRVLDRGRIERRVF